jgi:hypothetical protein
MGSKGLRARAKYLSNLKLIWAVQTIGQKYSAFQNTQISCINPPGPLRHEGRLRDRHQT